MFENIFSSLIDGVLLVSRDLEILKANPTIEELFGKSREALEGHPLTSLFSDQPDIYEKIRQTLDTGISFRDVECEGSVKNDSSTFPASLTISPYLDDTGAIQGVVILVKDLTLLKELEEVSRAMDHLSTLSPLAMGMAHEIRNPLGGIRASAQLLLDELKKTDQKKYLEVIISEVDRINRMVERIMNLTRPLKPNFQETNIHRILQDILLLEQESLNRQKIRVEQVYDPSLPNIRADGDLLKQVFLNLVKNAVQASPRGGKLQLITRVSRGYAVKSPHDVKSRQSIVVEIIDSGIGMDETELNKLFTPFFTTKSGGSGLGLLISLKIVENHGGKIKITSEKGLGTTVQVFLPV